MIRLRGRLRTRWSRCLKLSMLTLITGMLAQSFYENFAIFTRPVSKDFFFTSLHLVGVRHCRHTAYWIMGFHPGYFRDACPHSFIYQTGWPNLS